MPARLHKHNLKLLDEIFASDAISHDPQLANIARGPQGVRQFMQV